MIIPPLNIKILLESNPLKSRILVRRLAVNKSRGKIIHTRIHTSENSFENVTEHPLDDSGKNPLDK